MKNLALLMNFLGNERDSVETSQTQETKKQGRKNPMKMMSIIGFCLSLFTICLSSGAAEAARARVNSRSGLNVRREPSVNSTRVGGLSNGQVVNTTGRFSNGWAQLSNGYWVSNSYLNYNGGGTGGGTRTSLLIQISSPSGGANIRSGPGVGNRRLNYYRNGTPLTLTGRTRNGWYELTRGRGWIAGNLVGGFLEEG